MQDKDIMGLISKKKDFERTLNELKGRKTAVLDEINKLKDSLALSAECISYDGVEEKARKLEKILKTKVEELRRMMRKYEEENYEELVKELEKR